MFILFSIKTTMDKNIENKLTDAAKDGLNQTVQEIADIAILLVLVLNL